MSKNKSNGNGTAPTTKGLFVRIDKGTMSAIDERVRFLKRARSGALIRKSDVVRELLVSGLKAVSTSKG